MFPTNMLCPRCKCGACYPLHRKGVDWLLSCTGLRPVRCLTCLRKFYRRYTIEDSTPRRTASTDASAPLRASADQESVAQHSRAA